MEDKKSSSGDINISDVSGGETDIGSVISGQVGGDVIGGDNVGGDSVNRDKIIQNFITHVTHSPIGQDVPCLSVTRDILSNRAIVPDAIQFTDKEPEDETSPPLLYLQIRFSTLRHLDFPLSASEKLLDLEAHMRPALGFRTFVQLENKKEIKRIIRVLRRESAEPYLLTGVPSGEYSDQLLIWREEDENRMMIANFTPFRSGFSIHARFTDEVGNNFAEYLEKMALTT